MTKVEKVLAVIAALTVITAWVIGYSNENQNIKSSLTNSFTKADSLHELSTNVYKAYSSDNFVGYVAIGESNGYGGPLKSAALFDSSGNIKSVDIISNKETFAFFQKATSKDLLKQFVNKNIESNLTIGENIDVVSGATLTSQAIVNSVINSKQIAAREIFNIGIPDYESPGFQIGIKEIIFFIITSLGLVTFFANFKMKKVFRWVSLISGLLFLGFIYTIPMSLTNINSFLMGYFPNWYEQIYWYVLFAVVFLPGILKGVSPYCSNICPFGAAQECLSAAGGGKFSVKGKAHSYLKWLQRILAWGLITYALILRNPGVQNHEVFGAFFNLTGTVLQLSVMVFIVITALFINRPWCNYLCPVQAVYDYLKSVRNWLIK